MTIGVIILLLLRIVVIPPGDTCEPWMEESIRMSEDLWDSTRVALRVGRVSEAKADSLVMVNASLQFEIDYLEKERDYWMKVAEQHEKEVKRIGKQRYYAIGLGYLAATLSQLVYGYVYN